MLFRLLLALSLVGAWSLPALGCIINPSAPALEGIINPSVLPGKFTGVDMDKMLLTIDFDKLDSQEGGGTWHDSEGREGRYVSQKSGTIRRVRDCRGYIGCYSDSAGFYRYSIELDDGRKEWFKWTSEIIATAYYVHTAYSDSGLVDAKYVDTTQRGLGNVITIVDGDYTLTLVEERISVPNSITYSPRSNLNPANIDDEEDLVERRLLNSLLEILQNLPDYTAIHNISE